MDRRRFLKLSGGASVGLVLIGAVALSLRPTRRPPRLGAGRALDADELAILLAIARCHLPSPPDLPDAATRVTQAVDSFVASWTTDRVKELKRALRALDFAPLGLFTAGKLQPFTALAPNEQVAYLSAWRQHRWTLFRSVYHATKKLVLAAYYGMPETWPAIGYPGPPDFSELFETE